MKYIPRILDIKTLLKKKSYFLFGPRQTGKTSLVENSFKNIKVYNLLDSDIYLTLSRRPSRLREEISKDDKIVVIDEIQKLPILLDEIHLLIEKLNVNFLLTGSSARKLRRGGVNLLGGRARSRTLHPFIFEELKNFNLLRALNYGLIPSIYLSDSPEEDLKAYAGDYLREEIAAEGLTRNIPAFSRFLEVAALCNGTLINYSQISNDAQVPKSTVQEYFKILQDTLIAEEVRAWKHTKKRKPVSTSKFYFFDIGVVRHLQNRSLLKEKSPEFGDAFETYIFHELKSYIDYSSQGSINYWRSKSNFEVDFIINDISAIEVKGKANISNRDLKGLKALREEQLLKNYIVVSLEDRPRKADNIQILPWKIFLGKLWDKQFD
jgi:predicted AAA+ superfamily ATPase